MNHCILIGSDIDNCPPSDATCVEGVFYRFLKCGMDDKSFISRYNMGIAKKSCSEMALSLLPTKKAIEKFIKHFPSYKNSEIAKLTISQNHGKIQRDNINHANWWHPLEFKPIGIAEKINISEIEDHL